MNLMPKVSQFRQSRGFTLIELLIVIAIIGILTGLVTVNLQDARERARDVERKAGLKQIQNALELYKNDQRPQAYPTTADWRDDLLDGGYMREVPQDPTSVQSPTWPDYEYIRTTNLTYTLVACLENSADPARDDDNTCSVGNSYTITEP
jgi:prepilin-type N-terminal cleavage/methylation domain-containing protein